MVVSRQERSRQILDAAVRVFAAKGFNQCRVADIGDEAGVAYGLLYHYFASKDDVLDRLFVERWSVLLEAIAEAEARPVPARAKLDAIAGFVFESYRRDPDLMKVIIVEVTRAANTFGQRHYETIKAAHDGIARIIAEAQRAGEFDAAVPADLAAMTFYGALEQILTAWILGGGTDDDRVYERARVSVVEVICSGLDARPGATG